MLARGGKELAPTMTTTALLLLVVAAATHAGWNLIGKRHHPSAAFFMVALGIGTLWLVPASYRYWHAVPHLPPVVWMFLGLTCVCQAFYFIMLAGAYRHGHMSVAYPLARSIPALVVLGMTRLLSQGDPVTPLCIAGIVLVVVGGFVLPMRRLGELRLRNYLNASCLFAVLAAVGITGFTIIDDRALRTLRADSALGLDKMSAALVYFQFEEFGSALLLATYVFAAAGRRSEVAEVVRTKRLPLVVAGFGLAVTYTLVLTAMGYVTNVSYVYAFAQLSIPLGALGGVVLLREPPYVAKFLGAGTIFAGLVLVALG